MYDLPSEDPEEPGLPDVFHIYQPRLLSDTFCPPTFAEHERFAATDLNLYYDSRHPLWHKRPDWFAVVGIPRLYEERDLRLSYVVWQEGVDPFVVVELLSPGTEADDLGRSLRRVDQPPSKWQVYEQILRIPYYVVFDRYTDRLRSFMLQADRYMELELDEPRIWMESLELGLGLWQGHYEGINRLWLRWYDKDQNWILTPVEQEQQRVEQERQRVDQERQRADQERQRADQERQRAERERQRADRLADRLRQMGIDPDAD